MDGTTLIIIAVVAILVVVALLLRRLSWGSSPGYTQFPPFDPPVTGMPSLGADREHEVRALVAGGQKIEAIKLVRGLTGMGLKEAKDYVEAMPSLPPGAAPLNAGVAHVGGDPRFSTQDIESEMRVLVAKGNKIEAIKRVRELTGMGLKEAKDFVESLPATPTGVSLPLAGVDVGATGVRFSDPAIDPEVRALLAGGNKIAAIKRVRELTGMGLKEAKDFVESLESGYRQ